jgi:hypothetical protein
MGHKKQIVDSFSETRIVYKSGSVKMENMDRTNKKKEPSKEKGATYRQDVTTG